MQIEALYKIFIEYPSIQTDTRKLQQGDLFFALKGDNFNGNLFAKQALASGAAYAIIDEPVDDTDPRLIKTDNVLATLQALAKHHRVQFKIPFIAITGSNGKTTTKELVHEVLSTTYKTYTTKGNLNNHIGIPLTILSVKKDAEIAVIEMGANHQKEIEAYCTYTLPTHGIITNCGKAHLEGFGGIEGVKKGKGELFDYLRKTNGTAFIMNDYDYLIEMSKGIKEIKTYGTKDADLVGTVNESNKFLEVSIKKGSDIKNIQTNLVGEYNLPNVLLAILLGEYFKVPDTKIKSALENYIPSNSRSQLIEKDSNKIILDAYNANPTSMKAAIENFAKMQGSDKVLILGGMMELGEESIAEHKSIAALIDTYKWKSVVLVGGDFNKIDHHYINLANSTEAKTWLQQQHFANTAMLIKGSRSMQMEKVLEP
ncbi:UDP-N-acetylmuramoyl-tripeptide--D-alanyl-D-alanine ligase [Ferruginibacter lapsinanis]|uniref:UDP-N-acetylmuramoyl-tripeptide--D-alanyl-D- alanine ligase n=1 Tax=Ferruginibacter lapsinanis TaxID=563172 RepID=UPI001E4EFC40|nr:UDP-N-acetylmuramoyl-tripeptide--D-alanyl-D-alanine ligase [Ferruginibacter lapsinanis]UEG50245.1 UDP-N-acetylmuramoyl-tripeptide--D-alanyl-D-alanine ligase [Ferruginibacter lapsinanis]